MLLMNKQMENLNRKKKKEKNHWMVLTSKWQGEKEPVNLKTDK